MYSLGGPIRRRGSRDRVRRNKQIDKKREEHEQRGGSSGDFQIPQELAPREDERMAKRLQLVLIFARVITVASLSLYMVALWLLAMSNGWYGTTKVITALLWAAFAVLVLSLLVWTGRAWPALQSGVLTGVSPITSRACCLSKEDETPPGGGSSASALSVWWNWRDLNAFCQRHLKGAFSRKQGRGSGTPTEQGGDADC